MFKDAWQPEPDAQRGPRTASPRSSSRSVGADSAAGAPTAAAAANTLAAGAAATGAGAGAAALGAGAGAAWLGSCPGAGAIGCCGGGASHSHSHCAHSHVSTEPLRDWQGGSCRMLCCTSASVHGMDARSGTSIHAAQQSMDMEAANLPSGSKRSMQLSTRHATKASQQKRADNMLKQHAQKICTIGCMLDKFDWLAPARNFLHFFAAWDKRTWETCIVWLPLKSIGARGEHGGPGAGAPMGEGSLRAQPLSDCMQSLHQFEVVTTAGRTHYLHSETR